MIITNRDKKTLQFIEKYGSITINQCSKIFFKNCKENYYQARKRLKKLSDNKYLNRYRKDMRSETVYYLEKKLSIHDLKVLDVYAYLIYSGVKIKSFNQEYVIPAGDKNYRADALIEFIYGDYFYTLLIEVDYTHYTSQKKLFDIYNSSYFQNKYKNLGEDIFPKVVIIRPAVTKENDMLKQIDILYLDFDLKNIGQVLK